MNETSVIVDDLGELATHERKSCSLNTAMVKIAIL